MYDNNRTERIVCGGYGNAPKCYSLSTLTTLSTLIFRFLESKRKVMDSGKTYGFIMFFDDGRNHCGTGTQNVLQS